MLEEFQQFIQKEKLLSSSPSERGGEMPRILVTVSGGVDSVVMCHLFRKAEFSFGIAHCNFKLRGKESDADERFVKTLAEKMHVPFHRKSFRAEPFARRKKLSVQMAARELRYGWLKRLAKEKKYGCIATAHHLDDSIETFFINLLRGTGIAGLQGIPAKQGNIIRPLLFANKKMIRQYAEKENLQWREDSSNFSDKYLRNRIRHHLIPSLKKLNAGFEKTIVKELSYFKDAAGIFKKFMEEKKREIVEEEGKNILLNIKKLKDSGYPETILHEVLRAYDFQPETTELIVKKIYGTAGKKFLSPTYRLIKDREFLVLSPLKKKTSRTLTVRKNQPAAETAELFFSFEHIHSPPADIRSAAKEVAFLDADKLFFPLTIRKWEPGDFFYPLGMKGRKKLSDFLTDVKIPSGEKENAWVLLSKNEIAWVVCHRIDERFKLLPSTKNILRVEARKK